MVRFYKRPILLIEFDPNKSFSLQVSIHRNPVVKIKLASKCPSSNFQVSITVEHEIMGVRGYGISLGVFSSIVHEWDVELNTRTEISYLQTTMYYFVYHINTIALYCQQKSTLLMNENKRIDNPLIKKTLKSLTYSRWKQTMGLIFNIQNCQLFMSSLATEEIFQVHGQNRLVANLPVVDFRSRPREMLSPKRFLFSYFGFLPHLGKFARHCL